MHKAEAETIAGEQNKDDSYAWRNLCHKYACTSIVCSYSTDSHSELSHRY